MRVNIFGLGSVGTTVLVGLARRGLAVNGIETNPARLEVFRRRELPIYEPGLDSAWKKLLAQNAPVLCLDPSDTRVEEAEVSLVCVGTPSLPDGQVDLSQARAAISTLARIIARRASHTVFFRSTVPPGTTRGILIPELEALSGKKAGRDFEVYFYPEFLREGSALEDFDRPSLNIIGSAGGIDIERLSCLFPRDPGLEVVSLESAEMTKFVNNSFHALKVTFANELGTICKRAGLDSSEVFRIFLSDQVLNISEKYLRPGAPFGGSCLVKELQYLEQFATKTGMRAPLLTSILASNLEHTNRILEWVTQGGCRRLGIVGSSFKPDTDDIRNSPMVEIISKLMRAGTVQEITVLDLPAAKANLRTRFLDQIRYAASVEEVVSRSDALILGPLALSEDEMKKVSESGIAVLDLSWHQAPVALTEKARYHRLC